MSHSLRPLPSRRHGRQPRVAATVVAADDYSTVAATELPFRQGGRETGGRGADRALLYFRI